jgi:hypothetical protein
VALLRAFWSAASAVMLQMVVTEAVESISMASSSWSYVGI